MLSCHQLRKYYDQVELYTDEFGYHVLIEKLKLPYTKVHVVMDQLNELPGDLWSMAKLKAYELQEEPFLHVDGDIFIFEPFPEDLLSQELIAQNQEFATDKYYRLRWNKIAEHLTHIPPILMDFHQRKTDLAYNMGIVGGKDIPFFQRYCQTAYNFVNSNKTAWKDIEGLNFNVFFEQVLFNSCVQAENKTVGVLIKEDIGDNEYAGFGDFDEVPHRRTYLHLLGTYKQRNLVCSRMLQYCWYNHPELLKTFFDEMYTPEVADLNLKYTQEENRELIDWYRNTDHGTEITIRQLIARDLFNYEQTGYLEQLESRNTDYRISLLPEIIVAERETGGYNVSVWEILENSLIDNLEQIDELVLYELTTPLLKSELIKRIKDRLPEELTQEQESQFMDFLNVLLKTYVISKMIAITEP